MQTHIYFNNMLLARDILLYNNCVFRYSELILFSTHYMVLFYGITCIVYFVYKTHILGERENSEEKEQEHKFYILFKAIRSFKNMAHN